MGQIWKIISISVQTRQRLLLLGYHSGNLHNHLGSFFHRLYGHEFITPVKVQPTGENIGTRQSFERQLRSIGSATYRLHHRNNIYGPHSLGYQINDMHHRFDLLTHIIVLVVYFDGKMTLEEAVEKIKRNTRVYSKKQVTWYKKDLDMKWFSPDDKDGIIAYIDENSVL